MAQTLIKFANIGWEVNDVILKTFIGTIGSIQRMNVYKSTVGEGKECLIQFVNERDYDVALHLNGVMLGMRKISVEKIYHGFPEDVTEETNSLLFDATSGSGGGGGGGNGVNESMVNSPLNVSTNTQNVQVVLNAMRQAGVMMPGMNTNNLGMLMNNMVYMDPQKAEEIARTIYIGNLAPASSENELMAIFARFGPVICCKIAGDPSQLIRYAFLEFAEKSSADAAMGISGIVLHERQLKVNRSKNSIAKPARKTSNDAHELMRKVKEAQAIITQKYQPTEKDNIENGILETNRESKSPPSSRKEYPKSRNRSRSRSPHHSRRSHNRSRHSPRKGRSRSRSPSYSSSRSRRARSRSPTRSHYSRTYE